MKDYRITILPVAGKYMAHLDRIIRRDLALNRFKSERITVLSDKTLYPTPAQAWDAMLPQAMKAMHYV